VQNDSPDTGTFVAVTGDISNTEDGSAGATDAGGSDGHGGDGGGGADSGGGDS